MVGVPKSTGCAVCRKRKIKCDETWPNCINCRKNGKICPGPPARHTFKDLGPQLDVTSKSNKTNKWSAPQDQGLRETHLSHLKAKRHDTGAVFLKFRLSPTEDEQKHIKRPSNGISTVAHALALPTPQLYNPFSAVPHDGLARLLVEAMESDNIGYSISDFGSFMQEVPRRVGHNAALDAAVICLIHTRSAAITTKSLNDLETPKNYLAAVQKLQHRLEDRIDGMSPNTLCAAVLLSLVEALAGPRLENSYLAHVGGAGRLLEIQGPQTCRDDFAKEILRFTRGGIIVTSIYKSEPCFLSSPGWRDVAFDISDSSLEETLYTEVLHLMAKLSVLLKDMKALQTLTTTTYQLPQSLHTDKHFHEDNTFSQHLAPHVDLEMMYTLYTGPDASCTNSYLDNAPGTSLQDPTPPHPLLYKVHALKPSLTSTGAQLKSRLADGSFALELPSRECTNPLPTAYRFSHWRTARIYTIHWSLTILVNKTLLKLLPPYDPTRYALEAECRTVALEICKTWENAWANRPIGACHVWLGFVVAYEFCSVETRRWILGALNMFLVDQGVAEWRWTEEVVGAMSRRLMGEGHRSTSMGAG